MIYSQDRKSEIAKELWPFLRNGKLNSSYIFGYTEDSNGDPGNPAVVSLISGEVVSPTNWDGDTHVRDGEIVAYERGYIPGSTAASESALNKYFKREGEIKSASERYADEKRRKAIAKKIFLAVIGILLAGFGLFVYKKKSS